MRRSNTMSRHSLFLLVVLALMGAMGLQGCHSSPTKRALQYMNKDGFGRLYTGKVGVEDYIVPGDTVQIFDPNHPVDINATVTVSPDGRVLLDQVGRIKIAGYSRTDLEAVLAERYSQYYTTPTNIVVNITTSGKVFFVLGEVVDEGSKTFEGNLTVLDAVVEAQAKRDTANIGRAMLIRGDPRDPLRLPVNINDIIRGDTTTNYVIQEDDILWIPPTLFAQFGYFLRAALYPVTAVFQAIGGALLGVQQGQNLGNNNNRGILSFGGIF